MATFTKRPIERDDDCGYWGSTKYVSTSTETAGSIGSPAQSGIRWQNITIPQGATIVSAIITFRSASNMSGTTCNTIFYGNAVDSSPSWASISPNSITTTSASIAWNSIGAWTTNSFYDSPDLKSIVQEIIDRPGWSSGNNLAMVWRDNSSTAYAQREAVSWDGDPTWAPLLTIEYTYVENNFSGNAYLHLPKTPQVIIIT